MIDIKKLIEKLEEKWPSPIISRDHVGKFTGGLIAPKTMANLDSLGLGPGVQWDKTSKKAFYWTDDYCPWLVDRLTDRKPPAVEKEKS